MIKDTNFLDMALIDRVRVIKLLLFALFVMVRTVAPAQNQVDWSIKAGIGMANIIGDNMGSPKVKLAYKLGIGLGVFLWVLTEEEGLAAIGFLIFCMGLGQVLIAYTTTPHKKKKDDPFPPTRINQDENGAKSMKIENIELERNEEAKETQNIKNNIDTPHNEE